MEKKHINESVAYTFSILHENLIEKNYEISEKEKAKILFSIKNICLKMQIEKPRWWYGQRNRINWIKEDGKLMYKGINFGGF